MHVMKVVNEKISKEQNNGWKLIPLKDLGRWSGGGTPSKANPKYWTDGTIPWVSPKDMKTERITTSEDRITKLAVSESPASLIPGASVLVVTRSGILRHTLPIAVTSLAVTVNQDLKALTPAPGFNADYVAWALRAFSQDILNTCSKNGTTVNSIETSKLLRYEIPVAPLDQQKLIVAEVEKQFSRLDEAVANLKRVKANLKRYKAAVLKAAAEGRLVETEAERSRREGRSYETGAQLMQRILENRRRQWKGKGKYKESSGPDTTDLPGLPDGWVWASLEQSCVKITDGTHHSPKNFPQGEYKYITSKNVRAFRMALEDITFVDKKTHDEIYSRCDVRKGDVLYVKDGVNTGLAAKNTLEEPFSLLSSVGVFRTVSDLDSDYLVIYLNSTEVRDRMLANIAGVAITRLTLNKLKITMVAIPPLTEQHRIVAEVDRRFSLVGEVENQLDVNLKRAERMRQALLKNAFLGKLTI